MYSPNLFWHGRTNFDCVNFDGVNFCKRSMWWSQAFFEEKLEKIRKNLLGPPSGKVSSSTSNLLWIHINLLWFHSNLFIVIRRSARTSSGPLRARSSPRQLSRFQAFECITLYRNSRRRKEITQAKLSKSRWQVFL